MTVHIALVLGTRPEIIKLAPVLRECERRSIPYTLVHTGQHYSKQLNAVFFEQLRLAAPNYELDVGSKPHGEQTADMIHHIAAILRTERPDITLVQGDTNSTLAGALAACKQETLLGHVEAGLRSFDRKMPEELNRILADHAADFLFAPTETAAGQLMAESIPDERVFVTGNTVVDAISRHIELADRQSTVHTDHGITAGEYGVLTAHRAENVDDSERFQSILAGVSKAAQDLGIEILYPVHPRAESALGKQVTVPERIRLIEPLDYLDFLALERDAMLVFTDSGGVQEEACNLRTPCVTVRDSTERPETLEAGSNRLVGTHPDDIRRGAREMSNRDCDWENPFGDGTAGQQILDEILSVTRRREVV